MTKEMTLPTQFPFFPTYSNALARIPEESDRAKLALAIVEYGAWGIEPRFGDRWELAAVFEGVRINLDNSAKAYANGKKGGRPKKVDNQAIEDAYRTCMGLDSTPDDTLDADAAFMSDKREEELEAMRLEAELQAWVG